jgi:hypothetical protein
MCGLICSRPQHDLGIDVTLDLVAKRNGRLGPAGFKQIRGSPDVPAEIEIGSDFVAVHASADSNTVLLRSTSLPTSLRNPSTMVRDELRRFPNLVLSEAGEAALSERLAVGDTMVRQAVLTAEPKAVCLYAGELTETLRGHLAGDETTRRYVLWRICAVLLSWVDARLELSALSLEQVARLSESGEDLGVWLYELTQGGPRGGVAATEERSSAPSRSPVP